MNETEFIDYCWDFYGPGNFFGHFFNHNLTRSELVLAVQIQILEDREYYHSLNIHAPDSLDRKEVRDTILYARGEENMPTEKIYRWYDNLPDNMQVIIQDWSEDSIITNKPLHLKYGLIPLSALPNVPVNKETDKDFDGVRDEAYALRMDLNDIPPIIIANGVLMDGRHRIFAARAKGLKNIHAIDLTGIITERMSDIDGMGPIRY